MKSLILTMFILFLCQIQPDFKPVNHVPTVSGIRQGPMTLGVAQTIQMNQILYKFDPNCDLC